jgi:hypothetical protein
MYSVSVSLTLSESEPLSEPELLFAQAASIDKTVIIASRNAVIFKKFARINYPPDKKIGKLSTSIM